MALETVKKSIDFGLLTVLSEILQSVLPLKKREINKNFLFNELPEPEFI